MTRGIIVAGKVEFVRLFFGRNVGLKKSFQLCLTFIGTLITLLRIPYLCHFGSTSFVLPIRPNYGILNRAIRVGCLACLKFTVVALSFIYKVNENLAAQEIFQFLDKNWTKIR